MDDMSIHVIAGDLSLSHTCAQIHCVVRKAREWEKTLRAQHTLAAWPPASTLKAWRLQFFWSHLGHRKEFRQLLGSPFSTQELLEAGGVGSSPVEAIFAGCPEAGLRCGLQTYSQILLLPPC